MANIPIAFQDLCFMFNVIPAVFVVLTVNRKLGATLPDLVTDLLGLHGVEDLYLSHARN